MTKRGGLGRGLAALIPTSAPEAERPAPVADSAPVDQDAGTGAPAVSLVPPPPPVTPALRTRACNRAATTAAMSRDGTAWPTGA